MDLLGMQMEPVRTVLQNEVNEISVCVDLKRRTGVFYTMISIVDPHIRLRVAALLAQDGLFSQNSDFIGSYSQGDRLNLVFLYRSENLLAKQEAFYATSFPRRRRIAESVAVALAETQLAGPVGELLLEERNLNIAPDLTVTFNYFLDFKDWDPEREEEQFYRHAAMTLFHILSREYEQRFEGEVDRYPGELQAFYKKAKSRSFRSFNSLIAAVRMLPDRLSEPKRGWRRAWVLLSRVLGWFHEHSLAVFVAVLVAATVCYAAWQIAARLAYRSATAKNISYAGVQVIGDVSLGDETI